MLVDPHRDTSVKLATGNYYAVSVAPDQRRVAAVRGAEREPDSLNFHGRRGELQLFALNDSAENARLLRKYGGLAVSANSVSGSSLPRPPSGAHLLLVGVEPGGEAGAELYVVDADTGDMRKMVSPGLSFVNPSASDWGMTLPTGWIGEQPAAIATSGTEAVTQISPDSGKLGSRLEYGETRNKRFDLYTFGSGSRQNLTGHAKASFDQFLVPPGAGYAMVVADGALWKVTPGQEPRQLSPANAPRMLGFGVDHPLAIVVPAWRHGHGRDRAAGGHAHVQRDGARRQDHGTGALLGAGPRGGITT